MSKPSSADATFAPSVEPAGDARGIARRLLIGRIAQDLETLARLQEPSTPPQRPAAHDRSRALAAVPGYVNLDPRAGNLRG